MAKIWFRVGMEAEISQEEMDELLVYSRQKDGSPDDIKAHAIMEKLIKNGVLSGETYIVGKNNGGVDNYDNPDEEVCFEY